jgi:hypothetical protein
MRYFASSLSRVRPIVSLARRIEPRQSDVFPNVPDEKGRSGATLSAWFAMRSISDNNRS